MKGHSRILLLASALMAAVSLTAGSRENPIVIENACSYQVKVVFRVVRNGKETVFHHTVAANNADSCGLGADFQFGNPGNYIKEMMIDGTERRLADGSYGAMWFPTKDMLSNTGGKLPGPINRPWHFLVKNRKVDGKDLPVIETFQVAEGKALKLTNQ